MAYFFDAYAIIEIIRQNKAYDKFNKEVIITNILHFAEFYYFMLKNYGKNLSSSNLSKIDFVFLEITPEIIAEAMEFRFKHKKLKLSYADCIGYMTSLKNNLTFVTGDKEFETMEKVEFVK